jgi:hypothetical protein
LLDPSDKPTLRGRASTERELLMDRLEPLRDLKRRIAPSNLREQMRSDALQVAIDHVQAAIDALVAGQPRVMLSNIRPRTPLQAQRSRLPCVGTLVPYWRGCLASLARKRSARTAAQNALGSAVAHARVL